MIFNSELCHDKKIITFISNYVIRRDEISRYNLRFLAVFFTKAKKQQLKIPRPQTANLLSTHFYYPNITTLSVSRSEKVQAQ